MKALTCVSQSSKRVNRFVGSNWLQAGDFRSRRSAFSREYHMGRDEIIILDKCRIP